MRTIINAIRPKAKSSSGLQCVFSTKWAGLPSLRSRSTWHHNSTPCRQALLVWIKTSLWWFQKIQYTEKTLDAHSEEIKAIKEKVYGGDDNASSKKNLIIEQGTDFSFTVTLKDPVTKLPIDLTGYSFANSDSGGICKPSLLASLVITNSRQQLGHHAIDDERKHISLPGSENSLLRSRRYQHFKSKIPHPRGLGLHLSWGHKMSDIIVEIARRLRISLSSMTKFLRITSLRLPSEPKGTKAILFSFTDRLGVLELITFQTTS